MWQGLDCVLARCRIALAFCVCVWCFVRPPPPAPPSQLKPKGGPAAHQVIQPAGQGPQRERHHLEWQDKMLVQQCASKNNISGSAKINQDQETIKSFKTAPVGGEASKLTS